MEFSRQQKARLGMGLYALGLALGLLIAFFLAWADLETSLFDSGLTANKKMNMSCPLAITSAETGLITAEIVNDSERTVQTLVQSSQTEGSVIMIRRGRQQLSFAPGQVHQLEWPVVASDAAWGRVVMFRVFMVASSPLPALDGYCGILLINFPFLTGNQVLALMLVLALASVVVGGRMWLVNAKHRVLDAEKNARLLVTIAVLVTINVALAIVGDWLIAGAMFIVNFLLGLVIIAYQINRS